MEHIEEEKETLEKSENWVDYIHRMTDYVEKNDPNQLEDLLREEHPILPGEKEAYDWLVENLGREPRLKIDKTGYHIVPVEKED